jgi:hypothetical protein
MIQQKKYKLKEGERDPLKLIDVLENGYKITDGDRYAVRSWQQGKEYYQYILAKDIDKHEDFHFRGNDIIKERKKIEAEKIYKLLENLINNSPNYDKELYKIVHKNKFKLDENNTILFPTKESWTKSLEGMGSFVNENTILLVLESGNKTNKLTDIVGIGDGGWDISENEVISQKNSKFKILKTENIIFKTYDKNFKMKKITITSI